TDGGGVGDGEEVNAGTDPRDPTDDSGPGLSQSQAVLAYAPFVSLHPRERWYPMGATSFVNLSKLKFAHDNCKDTTVEQIVSPLALGNGGYTAQQTNNFCIKTGPNIPSDQLTRPDDTDSRKVTDLHEGFFLDLLQSCRSGVTPIGACVGEDGYSGQFSGSYNGPRIDYSFVNHRYITYWFMYGMNLPGNDPSIGGKTIKGGKALDRHEGEWERVTVQLDGTNHAVGMWYFAHFCQPVFYTWPGRLTPPGTTSQGTVPLREGHPLVYSALGSHASYPVRASGIDPVNLGATNCGLIHINPQDETGEGAQWRTWTGSLINAATEPWYGTTGRGYGGAWGEVGSIPNAPTLQGLPAINTGPLGPPWKFPFPS
ncbi:MAG: hypothetical protein M3P43_09475, partial [Actinomycetota bacterium]|nr:hypothetical protein [Actinomycetota bacterium]